jgi:hypothetical protein
MPIFPYSSVAVLVEKILIDGEMSGAMRFQKRLQPNIALNTRKIS